MKKIDIKYYLLLVSISSWPVTNVAIEPSNKFIELIRSAKRMMPALPLLKRTGLQHKKRSYKYSLTLMYSRLTKQTVTYE